MSLSFAAMQRNGMSGAKRPADMNAFARENRLRFNFANLIFSSFRAAIPSQNPGASRRRTTTEHEIFLGAEGCGYHE